MKYHALFVIFEKAAKFEIVVCCKLYVMCYGLKYPISGTIFWLVTYRISKQLWLRQK